MVAGIAAALFCVTVVGGYKLDWTWTGYSDNDTLWDWLGLVVLPVVIALVPIWYRTHTRLRVEWIALTAIVLIGWAVLLVGGYGLGWEGPDSTGGRSGTGWSCSCSRRCWSCCRSS